MALLRRLVEPVLAVARAVEPRGGTIEVGRWGNEAWQSAAWRYWHDLGEIHYPTSQVARLVSRLAWEIEEGQGDLDVMFAEPGVSELARLIALNLQVAGEGWLILTEKDKQGNEIDAHWEVLSVTVAKLKERLDRAEIRVRFWNPDPEDPNAADSAVRAALGPASELTTLQAQSRSQSMSRIATAGFLLRPASKRPMVDEAGNPIDFSQMLTDAMTAAIADETSAAAVVPIDVEIPQEEIEAWKFLIPERPYDDKMAERTERSIRRIALALDIWPELLLGIADVNHWNAWFLAEDTWQGHIAPLAEQVAGTLEIAANKVDGSELTIIGDPSELLAHRSSVRDALDSAELGAVGLRYVRDVIGAEEEDAPTEDEIELILRMKGVAEVEEPEESEPAVEENPGPPDTQEDSEDVPEMPVAAAAGDQETGLGVELARIDDQLRSWLEGGADQVVMLARSRVGMKARAALRGDPRTKQIDGVQNSEVVHHLGPEAVYELIDVPSTVRTTVEPFASRWHARLVRSQRQIEAFIGEIITEEAWELARKESSEVLVDELTDQTLATLAKTDSEMGTVDLRRVVAAAGV